MPSALGLVVGCVLHVLWFAACEALAPAAPFKAPRVETSGVQRGPRLDNVSADSSPRPASAGKGFTQTPILAVFDESPDIKTIRIRRPEAFVFKAGQFIPVRIRVDGKEHVRCYSISSSPLSGGFLEISVKRQGVVSNALHATARIGGILTVKAPNGHFTYPSGDDRPLVLLAGGVGITPLVSMLRYAVHSEPSRPVTLIYSAHTHRSLAFYDELVALERRHPQVRVVFAVTRDGSPGPAFYPGRVDGLFLQTMVPSIRHAITLMCGPAAMLESLRAELDKLGVPRDQVRFEVFEAAVAASTRQPDSDASVPVARREQPSGAACAMRCLPNDATVEVGRGQTILEAAEHAGVDVPSLCRAGVCGTCRVRVTEGDVDCESSTLDAGELAQGYVLACVATPRTDCTVQL
ncbi:MAG: iron-sulfur cluster-binding domain-containing protein [Vicinamibacterales bacterium]